MKGGILIIGSLFWEDHQERHKNLRKNWRSKRLSMKDKIHIMAPIRYGRKSKNSSYTMVFSKQVEINNTLGTAYFVPFKKELKSFKTLSNQAEYLSEAEGAEDVKLVKGGNRKWCVIGILFNPKFNIEEKNEILKLFAKKLIADGLVDEYANLRVAPEPTILSKQGEINISWPSTINIKEQKILDTFDFMLATCTQAKPDNSYPSIKINNSYRLLELQFY